MLTTEQLIYNRGMLLFEYIPRTFCAYYIRFNCLFFNYRGFFVLQVWNYISEEFMAIMLIHWRKFIYYFCLYMIWRDNNNNLFLFSSSKFLLQLLIILFKPDILVKLSKWQWQAKIIADSWYILKFSIFSV